MKQETEYSCLKGLQRLGVLSEDGENLVKEMETKMKGEK